MSLLKVFDAMGYNMEKAFERFGCHKIYEDKVVVVAGSMRRRGLGEELVRRSHLLAEERGCEYTYLWATGEYSGRMFQKMGFTLDSEVGYDQLKLPSGDLMLSDLREHRTGRIFYKKLTPIDT